jgi:phosphatidate cytidylyltransferase
MTWKRIATAVVLIPIVIGLVLYASTIVVAIVTGVIIVLALWEFFSLGDAIGHRPYRFWTIFCALLFLAVQLIHALWTTFSSGGFYTLTIAGITLVSPPPTTPLFFFFALGLAVITLLSRRPLVEVLPSIGISATALLFVASPLSFAVRIHGIPFEGRYLLLFALVITWAADTSAYFVGRAIGKHPFAPNISPKKTWEGAIASMVGSLIAAGIMARWIDVSLPHLFAMAALGNVFGQVGDLFESACKRSAGVKDSGGLLPGHGGALDRIDALIFCIPVIWYYLAIIHPTIL